MKYVVLMWLLSATVAHAEAPDPVVTGRAEINWPEAPDPVLTLRPTPPFPQPESPQSANSGYVPFQNWGQLTRHPFGDFGPVTPAPTAGGRFWSSLAPAHSGGPITTIAPVARPGGMWINNFRSFPGCVGSG